MKKRFHKLTALLLSALMVCSVVTTGEVSVGAAEVGVSDEQIMAYIREDEAAGSDPGDFILKVL